MLTKFNLIQKQKTKTNIKSKKKNKTKSKKSSKIIKKSKKNINEVGLLSNGMKFFVKEIDTQKETSIILLVKTGSINEGKYQGLSHLLEHLLFTGTKTYSNSQKLNAEFENSGSRINAYTDQETTGYYITCHHSKISKTLKLLGEMIKETNLETYRIHNEKKIVENEIKYRQDKIDGYVHKLLLKTLLKKTEYGGLVIGTPESLSKIEKYHLHAYLISRYKPENMTIGLIGRCGNYNFKDILEQMNDNFGSRDLTKHYQFHKGLFKYKEYLEALKYFNQINKKQFNNYSSIQKKINYSFQNLKINSKLVYVNIVFNGLGIIERTQKDQNNQDLLDFIIDYLDLGMSSKLFETIREEHFLVYNIGCKNIKFSSFGFINIKYSIIQDLELIQKSINIVFQILHKLKTELLETKTIKNIYNKNQNRKKTKNLKITDIGIKKAEFILHNNIKTKFFKENYLSKALTIIEDNDLKTKKNKQSLHPFKSSTNGNYKQSLHPFKSSTSDNNKQSKKNNKKEDTSYLLNNKDIMEFSKVLFDKKTMSLIILSPNKIKATDLKLDDF